MSETSFDADASTMRRFSVMARLVVSLVLTTGALLYSGAAWGWVAGGAAFILLIILVNIPRLTWGDRVTVSNETITVSRQADVVHTVPLEAISAARISDKGIVIAWIPDGKRQVTMIPPESFTPATWSELSAAIAAALPTGKLDRSGVPTSG